MSRRTNTAPIGTDAFVIPLATVIRSGTTPKASAAKGAPSRPKPADQLRPRRLALRLPVGQRNLERTVHRFGARVREEHVVEVTGCELGKPRGQLELQWVAHLEPRSVIHPRRLLGDRPRDRL